MADTNKQPGQVPPAEDTPVLNYEEKRIADWLKKVRFKKKLFGGVSELDVWKKLEELNSMYKAALAAERARYDAQLEIWKKLDELSQMYNTALAAERTRYEALRERRTPQAEDTPRRDGGA